MSTFTLEPERLTVDKISSLATSLANGEPIDPKALGAALTEIAEALTVLLHTSQHASLANAECDGPDDCAMRLSGAVE